MREGLPAGLELEPEDLDRALAHDEILWSEDRGFHRETNQAGGLEGGMTTGDPLIGSGLGRGGGARDTGTSSGRLVFVGLMGAGKSSAARAAAGGARRSPFALRVPTIDGTVGLSRPEGPGRGSAQRRRVCRHLLALGYDDHRYGDRDYQGEPGDARPTCRAGT